MAEKWRQNDNLREMTSKFNALVEELEELKSTSNSTNQETQNKITQLTQQFSENLTQTTKQIMKDLGDISDELAKKIESESDDIELEDSDLNVSDINRPVSIPQQEAINAAKEAVLAVVGEKLTSTEIGSEIEQPDDPEVSQPVKDYVIKMIAEVLANRDTKAVVSGSKLILNSPQMGVVGYNVAGNLNWGVVKPSEDVHVDPTTGRMSVPQLAILAARIEEVNNTLLPALKQTIKGLQSVAKDVGDVQKLQTKTKQDLASAINEVLEVASENNTP